MNVSRRAYENLPLSDRPRTWAEIDLPALRKNYRTLCKLLCGNAKPIAVVKADAYGHGMAACVEALFGEGCRRFAVSCVEEGIALRKTIGNEAEILILGYTDPACAPLLIQFNLSQALLSCAYAEELCRAAECSGGRVRVQYALDTGMNRVGFPARSEREIAQTAADILRFYRESAFLSEGMFTHFACADDPGDPLTDLQSARFSAVRKRLFQNGVHLFCHCCNSAGAILRPRDHFNAVRLGILLWGVSPSDQVHLPLSPVMRLCTRVAHLHCVEAGDRVGYGGAYRADRGETIATFPIGYADGWLRAYKGATVTIETKRGPVRAPLVGRICMDQCMGNVTGFDVNVGDRVVLFGKDPNDLSALANRAGTIPYESLCLISSRVPRVYQE